VAAPGPEASVSPPGDRSEFTATGESAAASGGPGSRSDHVTGCGEAHRGKHLRVANRANISHLACHVLNDQHRWLVGVVVPLADHAQRSLAEMDPVAPEYRAAWLLALNHN
jgi:hypothetical protein